MLDGLIARVLGRVGGERTLTDLRHVGEALHKVAVSERFGVVGLLGWLRTQVADDKIEVASERTRRLDSDAAAVQLVTIHGSKGLEYPVVYLPTLWDRWVRDDDVPLFHDDRRRALPRRGRPSRWRDATVAASRREDAGESLRLLYVALTRAQSQVVAWYCPTATTPPPRRSTACCSGVPRGMPASTTSSRSSVTTSSSTSSAAGSRPAGRSPRWPRSCRSTPTPIQRDLPPLAVRTFDRDVDTDWRRTSYSALSAAGAPHAGAPDRVLSEPDDAPELDDADLEPLDDATPPEPDLELAAVPSPMADLPVGADVRLPRPRGARARRPGCARLPRRAARAHRGAPRLVAGRARRRGAGRRARRGLRLARWVRWRAARPCATSSCPTGSASSTSSCRWQAATWRRRATGLGRAGRPRPPAPASTCPTATRSWRSPPRSRATPTSPDSGCSATSPARSTS